MKYPEYMDENEGYEDASDAGEALAEGWNNAINATRALNPEPHVLLTAVRALVDKLPTESLALNQYFARDELLAVRTILTADYPL